MQESPAKVETPLVVRFLLCLVGVLSSYPHVVLIRVLILSSTSGGLEKYMTDVISHFTGVFNSSNFEASRSVKLVEHPFSLVGFELNCSVSIKTTLLTPSISQNIFT
jgi:hypothetical protein